MRIDRLQISNFRNFKALDVRLDDHAVIVGENRAGKTNLLHALRLVLDPSLPDTARQLREEDFWDGLERPLSADDRIVISVDFAEFEESEEQLSSLAEHLISSEPMVARLTYVFERAAGSDDPNDCDFCIYGGGRPENVVHSEIRRRLPLDLLPALRDAESELANRRRSPLGALLDQVVADANQEEMEEIAEQVTEATTALAELPAIKELSEEVTDRLASMVGSGHAGDFLLGVGSTDPQRLIRTLRPLIDAGRRGIGEASLGSASLIYLALKSLELELMVDEGRRDHTFLGIEEPEAHLHPHLQRLTFRHFLEQRGAAGNTTVLLTTHSPHIVSVAPLRTLIVLRRAEDGSTGAVSTAHVELTDEDVADLERYLDVTRGEIVFSRGVLLVEGDAEKFLVPKLAELNGYNLDELGISVCSVAGTNFLPYIKFLGTTGLQIPHAVITDFDEKNGRSYGAGRVRDLLQSIGVTLAPPANNDSNAIRTRGAQHGFFLNSSTFEVEMFRCGRHRSMTDTLSALTSVAVAGQRAQQWRADPNSLDETRFLADITEIGKGRFAQRLASVISAMTSKRCPDYIKQAITYVAERIQ